MGTEVVQLADVCAAPSRDSSAMADANVEMRDRERLIGRHWVNYDHGKWAGWSVVSDQRIRFTARMNSTQYKTSLAIGTTASSRGTGWTIEIPRDQVVDVRYSKGLVRSRCEVVLADGVIHEFRRDTYGIFGIKKFTASARAMFTGDTPAQALD
jgi:hypothetical protein